MLRKYSFKNYLSFMDETIVSLESSQPDEFVTQDFDGKYISLATSIVGSNASGKTTLLKPLALLEWLISQSFYGNEDQKIPVEKHFFSDSEASEFMFEFSSNNVLYKYELTIINGYIALENLFQKGKTRFEYIIKRSWVESISSFNVVAKDKTLENVPALKNRKNASILAILPQLGLKLFSNIGKMIQSINLSVGSLEGFAKLFNYPHFSRDSVAKKFSDDNSLLEKIAGITKNLDLGVAGVLVKETIAIDAQGESVSKKSIFIQHKYKQSSLEVPLAIESSGTQSLMILLSKIFPVLDNGGVVVVDEIESDLHPLMIQYLLKIFSDPEMNPKNAQIIFTTHSIEIINMLEKSQIFLVEKNDCVSESWRLDEVQGVRRDDNYYAKYMAGAYGAIPRI